MLIEFLGKAVQLGIAVLRDCPGLVAARVSRVCSEQLVHGEPFRAALVDTGAQYRFVETTAV